MTVVVFRHTIKHVSNGNGHHQSFRIVEIRLIKQ